MADTQNGVDKVITKELFDRYMSKIAPYGKKVIEQKIILSPEEIKELETLEKALFDEYDYLSARGILGEIERIIGHSRFIMQNKREDALYTEYQDISGKYRHACQNGKLSETEEEKLLKHLRELRPLFADSHY